MEQPAPIGDDLHPAPRRHCPPEPDRIALAARQAVLGAKQNVPVGLAGGGGHSGAIGVQGELAGEAVPAHRLAGGAKLAAVGDFSGAILIAEAGRVVYAHAGGLSDREHRVADTLQTRFRMASMGKMFTAVAVVQLAEAGRLDLDATVGTYLPDYPNASFARTVTLRQLLTHTGGAGDFMSQTWADNYQTLKTPADYIALFGARAPEFTPGSRFVYANYGFVVLGRVVEAVSGQSYEDYLRGHVFEPAGMSHSGLNGEPAKSGVLATRYVKTSTGYNPPPAPFSGAATPAGGAYSTVGDMIAFASALSEHRLLDAAHTELLLTGQVTSESGRYALGFEDRSAEGRRDIGHDGGGPGENGCFRMLGGHRATVVVLSNVAPTWRADKLCAFIAARLDALARGPLSTPGMRSRGPLWAQMVERPVWA
jgi:D-alanyl-D-alanine carboxypeptidase